MIVRADVLGAFSILALSVCANAAAHCRPPVANTVLHGVIRSIGVVQEEPQERPQATFFLDVPQPDGKPVAVLVVLPAPIACREKDRATVSGQFDVGLGVPMVLSPRILSCGR